MKDLWLWLLTVAGGKTGQWLENRRGANKITKSFETQRFQKKQSQKKEALHNGRGPSRRSKQCKSQKKSVEGGEQLRE